MTAAADLRLTCFFCGETYGPEDGVAMYRLPDGRVIDECCREDHEEGRLPR